MKKHILIFITGLFLVAILATNCKKDETADLIEENGLSAEINNLVSKDVFEVLDSLDMIIIRGDDPPEVKGSFMVNPNILLQSTNETDVTGTLFTDYFVTFRSPDEGKSSFVTLTSVAAENKGGNGSISYISGEGSSFSVFTRMETTFDTNNVSYITIEVFSGTIKDDRIENLYNASVMIDHNGDVSNQVMEIGEGRKFMDGDNISQKIGF